MLVPGSPQSIQPPHGRRGALFLCLALAACQRQAPPAPTPYVPLVVARPATRTDATRELHLSGTLEADRSTSVSFAIPGTVEQVYVQEGDSVQRGQILAKLSPRSYEDALGIATSQAEQVEDAYRRLEPMHKNKTLPEVKMVEVETGRTQARIAISMAKRNLEDTVLRAREAGVVTRRSVEPGGNVLPGIPVLTVVQTKTMVATVSVPETNIAKIKRGDAARIEVPALGKTLEGTIRDLAIIADPLTRSYEAKVALPNPAGELRVGMIVAVHVRLPGAGPALVVPPEAVRVDEAGTPSVFVVRDRRLERRTVEVAGFVGEGTAVAKGLAEGELVVTSGTPMLADGMTVRMAGQEAQAKQP